MDLVAKIWDYYKNERKRRYTSTDCRGYGLVKFTIETPEALLGSFP
jgi:hypothetical protein